MRPFFSDTQPAAEAVQLDLMRRMSPAQRVSIARALGIRAFSLVRRSVREAYPDSTELEQKLKFIEMQYGRDLAERVREYCRGRDV